MNNDLSGTRQVAEWARANQPARPLSSCMPLGWLHGSADRMIAASPKRPIVLPRVAKIIAGDQNHFLASSINARMWRIEASNPTKIASPTRK